MKKSKGKVEREYGPFPDAKNVGGVTYDGNFVWAAQGDKLNAFDPATGQVQRSLKVSAHAGTAFDGQVPVSDRRKPDTEGRPGYRRGGLHHSSARQWR